MRKDNVLQVKSSEHVHMDAKYRHRICVLGDPSSVVAPGLPPGAAPGFIALSKRGLDTMFVILKVKSRYMIQIND